MKVRKNLTVGLACLMLLNTSPVFSAEAGGLVSGIKTMQAAIDSGKESPADAIDRFSKTIVEKNISLAEVNTFVKTKMTAQQFSKFQKQMDSALRGIDPDTLTSSEVGDMVGQSLAAIRTEGLYWSGCSKVWTGAAVIAAAIIAGTIAIGKSKSTASIQKDYDDKINSTRNYSNQSIDDTNHWQTAYPNKISNLNSDVRNRQSDINNYQYDYDAAQRNYNNSTTDADRTRYSNEMSSISSSISSAQSSISYDLDRIEFYSSKIVEYNQNPAQVSIDAQATANGRDAAIANLEVQQKNAIAQAPADQKLGKQLGIGAGVGAAIGAGLLINGIKEGACN